MLNKIMIVGDYKWNIYEEALIDGLEYHNIKCIRFETTNNGFISRILNFKKIIKNNNKLIEKVSTTLPDVIFFYRTNEVLTGTINKIKTLYPKIKLIAFHNDDPYVGFKNKLKFYLFLHLLPKMNLIYLYRPSNINDIKKIKVEKKLFMPHYYTKKDLVESINFENKSLDIIFIGHYEPNRAEVIDYLIQNKIKVKIFGPHWENTVKKYNWSEDTVNKPVYGNEYRNTIHKSKLAICFLSRINNDVYTRRNFEIPAAGTLTISEYTKELSIIFKDNEDILLFKNKEELLSKVENILNNPNKLKTLTNNSFNKIKSGKFSENDRAKQLIEDIDALC
jgi:spore maturation protein CgeB